jgi:hypothetical protein
MTADVLLRRLERAEVRARALAAPAAVPGPIELFRAAVGEPDDWQAEALRSTSPRVLMNCCRQSGKSSVTAVLGLHAALARPGALVLLLAPAWRQSAELLRKVLDAYAAIGRPVPSDAENRLSLELANGGRIISLPGRSDATIRGYSGATLLIVDEASRVDDALYYSIRPMLAVSGGRLVTLSTPFGNRGWWHQEWTEGGPTWERFEVPATACPRIPVSFLEEERRALPDWFYQAEYECRFLDAVDAVFRHDDIAAAVTPDIRPLWGVA